MSGGASGDVDDAAPSSQDEQEVSLENDAISEAAPSEPEPSAMAVAEDSPPKEAPLEAASAPAETVVTHKHKHSLTIQLSGGTSSKLPFGLSNANAKEAPLASAALPKANGTGNSGDLARDIASLSLRLEEVEAAAHNLDAKSKVAETERQQLSDFNTV